VDGRGEGHRVRGLVELRVVLQEAATTEQLRSRQRVEITVDPACGSITSFSTTTKKYFFKFDFGLPVSAQAQVKACHSLLAATAPGSLVPNTKKI
jgi:hypothetical protein